MVQLSGPRTGNGFLPWAGLTGGFLGFAIVHQWGSDGVFDDCGRYPTGAMLLILLLGLALAGVGALGSLMVARGEGESTARRFVAMISLGSAALFSLAMLLPSVASWIIPQCFG